MNHLYIYYNTNVFKLIHEKMSNKNLASYIKC